MLTPVKINRFDESALDTTHGRFRGPMCLDTPPRLRTHETLESRVVQKRSDRGRHRLWIGLAEQTILPMDNRLAYTPFGDRHDRRTAGIRFQWCQPKGFEPWSISHESGAIEDLDDLIVFDTNSGLERDLRSMGEGGELIEVPLIHDVADPQQAPLVLRQMR